ncbi:murein DD-endopeptidase MepM/ murein hydrolase activator NlpD [Chitinivorax tropicus]|uniref:Murein DD-endopeptidase MepM/ murein hydrolase activator NlpD n=1 Tax=Chitinivorax tropicus TaxID=714531 RepID=A0A840MW92_9PROT|nr:M23 family metallopeptidase [Chitinivorax tropicus]MBB5020643.1 murein DD-endopeptidase MepM/ murein hydrolase activator NlpD [Chitinivorax tropicus]
MALKLIGANELCNDGMTLYIPNGQKRKPISSGKYEQILELRLDPALAIDAAAWYAHKNLTKLKDSTGIDAFKLPPDQQIKVAYALHHEGSKGGVLFMTGKLKSLQKDKALRKLGGQLKPGKQYTDMQRIEAAEEYAKDFEGDYAEAYYYWLINHMDAHILVKNFMCNHEGFEEKSAFDVLEPLLGFKIRRKPPKAPVKKPSHGKAGKTPSPQSAKPAPPASSTAPVKSAPVTAGKPPAPSITGKETGEIAAMVCVGGDERWHNPLAACAIRIGGYHDSITNPKHARLKSSFGPNRTEIKKGKVVPRWHHGIDLQAAKGTEAFAVVNGVVEIRHAKKNDKGYGNCLTIKASMNDLPERDRKYLMDQGVDEKDYVHFFYGHLSEFLVEPAKGKVLAVEAGQLIGKTGDTGNAKGMVGVGFTGEKKDAGHLHFEVYVQDKKGGKKRVDPLPLIKNCK